MIAVLLLDGNVLPVQYLPGRIVKDDVQQLLQKVQVNQEKEYSQRFPDEMACDITITLKDGTEYHIDKKDYKGFVTRPASWESTVEKFHHLSAPFTDEQTREEIIAIIKNLEEFRIKDLMEVLEEVQVPAENKKI